MNKFILCGSALFLVFLFNGCGQSLQDYSPKSEKEKEIKSLLVEFAKARNDYDVNKMASSFSDNSIISLQGRSLTKSEFASVYKRSDFKSMGKIQFTNPEINIVDEIAQVGIKCKQGLTSWIFKFKVIRENDGWKISEWTVPGHSGY